MKGKLFALMAVIAFAGSSLFADQVGIGLKWGVGMNVYNDARFSSVSQILELSFKIDKAVSLVVLHETVTTTYREEFISFEYTATVSGLGLSYEINKWVDVGIMMGKGDGAGETIPVADIGAEIDLLESVGDKIAYDLSIGIKYRFANIEDFDFFGNGAVKDLNHTQLALKLGVIF